MAELVRPATPAPLEGRAVVADGAPCPIHGLPTRLVWVQGLGSYSQCEGCRDDFLRWYADHARHVVRGGPEFPPPPLREQAELI